MRHAIFILAIILLSGCHEGSGEGEAGGSVYDRVATDGVPQVDEAINVVCTTGMIADIASYIGGDDAAVYGMMGPGVDPHLYQATTSDVQQLADADIVFYNGLHLEAKLGDLLVKLARERPVIAVTQDIPEEQLLSPEEFEGLHDPHVWMDVELWMIAARTVGDALMEHDPDSAVDYDLRTYDYIASLEELQTTVEMLISTVPEDKRVLVTAHDAFNYFGQAYGFEVRGLQGISTQAEAGTADVRELADFIVERQIPAVFVESSVPQRNIEAVQAACTSRGFEVAIGGELFSDAMGSAGTPEGTYVGMIRHNVESIVHALAPIEEEHVPLSEDPQWANP